MAPPDEEQWAEWAAHNLALGVADASVHAELVKSGLSDAAANEVLAATRKSPAFRAAVRIARDLKKWSSLNEVLLDLEAEVYDFTRIPRVSGLSEREFLECYYSTNRPVIIEDVVNHWPACSKWNIKFLKDNFGSETVKYQSGRSPDDHRDAFVDHTKSGLFSEYLALIESGDETADYYLIAHDRLLEREGFRPLLEDIHFDPRYFDEGGKAGRVFFWLGPRGSTTPMHRDLGNVFFAQISGEKLVKMIPSKQMHLMYNDIGYHSEADFSNLSFEEFPLLRKAHIMEEVIRPGELLFIPVGWWHFVRSLSVTITVTGNNFKFRNAFTPIF